MGYAVFSFSYATKRKSCGFARIFLHHSKNFLFGWNIYHSNRSKVNIDLYILPFPQVLLSFCLNAVPAPVKRCCLAHSPKERTSQNRIPFSRSFSCQPVFEQQKKPVHPDGMYRPKTVRLLLWFGRRVITSKCNWI